MPVPVPVPGPVPVPVPRPVPVPVPVVFGLSCKICFIRNIIEIKVLIPLRGYPIFHNQDIKILFFY